MAQCRGNKADGTRCQANNAQSNGFCPSHQDQVPAPTPRASRTVAAVQPTSAGLPNWVKPVAAVLALVALIALVALLATRKSCNKRDGSKPSNALVEKGMSADPMKPKADSEKPLCLEPPDCRRPEPVKPVCLEPPDCTRPEPPKPRYRPRRTARLVPPATVEAKKPTVRYILVGPADDKGGITTSTIVLN